MPNIRPLSSALAKIAEDELNEVPDRVQADLDAFREWILKSPYLNARTDDQFLIVFLRYVDDLSPSYVVDSIENL